MVRMLNKEKLSRRKVEKEMMKKRTIAALLAIMLALAVLPNGASLAQRMPERAAAIKSGPAEIDDVNFPDEIFRNYIAENFDSDGNGVLSEAEIAEVQSIIVNEFGISDLSGIELFPALTTLYAPLNHITELDVSRNTALEYLHFSDNQVSEIDISSNPNLVVLVCSNNRISELDISNNLSITDLSCYNNQITSLDVTRHTSLEFLGCDGNPLGELDIANNPELYYLDCTATQLTELDVSNNPLLNELYCGSNQLTELDLSNNPLIAKLGCSNNQLSELYISDKEALTHLNCDGNELAALDVTQNANLRQLFCHENRIEALDVTHNPELEVLKCSYNRLTSIDISKCPKLDYWFACAYNEYHAVFSEDGTLDLSTLPGSFDVSKASYWEGGSVDGTILTLDEGADRVTYTYDCGKDKLESFTILTGPVTETPEPVTPEPVTPDPNADAWYFESDAELNEWTILDQDGDGYNWGRYTRSGDQMKTYEGDGVMMSFSYVNTSSGGFALTPDNWLITPEFVGGGSISFWMAGQDSSFAAEPMGIYVTTDDGATWSDELGYFVADGEFVQQTIDLSDYAGMTIKVAFRHYDVSDMFALNLDAVEVQPGTSPETPEPITDAPSTDEPNTDEPIVTDEPNTDEPIVTDEPITDAPTDIPVEPTDAPNPPATGAAALIGVGIAAIVGGAGVILFKRKED